MVKVLQAGNKMEGISDGQRSRPAADMGEERPPSDRNNTTAVERAKRATNDFRSSAEASTTSEAASSDGPGKKDAWTTAAWVSGLGPIANILSESLIQPIAPNGTPPSSSAQIEFIRSLGGEPEEVGKAAVLELLMGSPVLVRLADALWAEARTLARQEAATARELQSKFEDDGAFTLRYGGMETFFGGLEKLLGSPSANLVGAMKREHCYASDSRVEFTTPNYGVTTTCETEWYFVADPDEGLELLGLSAWPIETQIAADAAMREALSMARFEAAWSEVDEALEAREFDPLQEAEFLGARLCAPCTPPQPDRFPQLPCRPAADPCRARPRSWAGTRGQCITSTTAPCAAWASRRCGRGGWSSALGTGIRRRCT